MDIIEMLERRDEISYDEVSFKDYFRGRAFGAVLVAVVCLLILIGALLYTGLSKDIYFWDSATYWEISRNIASSLFDKGFLYEVYNSVTEMDYNYIAAIPSALWMRVFGFSRMSYVASLIVIYVIPFVLVIYSMAKKMSKAPYVSFVLTVLLMPLVLYMAYIGFADAGGMLIALLCYNLYYTKTGVTDKKYRYVIIGILLVLIMVFRRYFAFFSVSFFTAMVADSILYDRKKKNVIITGAVIAFILLALLLPYVINILLKDYGDLYSGYKYDVMTDLKLITRYYGLGFLIVTLLTPLISIITRQEHRPVFALMQIFVCFIMFISTQSHGQQHLLMYVPAFAVLIIFLVNCVNKRWMLLGLCCLSLLNFGSVCINRPQPANIQEIRGMSFFPTFTFAPEKRTDTQAILALKRELDAWVPEGAKCAVLASSFVLNDGVIRNVEPSLNLSGGRDSSYITGLPEVDSRDFWRLNEIYTAEYILVADPPQTHLAQGEQTITQQAVASFNNNSDIALSFEKAEGFERHIGNIRVNLYKRVKDVDLVQKTEFELRLYK